MNYVHSWTSPTTKKEETPNLQAWPFAWSCEHAWHVVCLLSITEKGGVVAAFSGLPWTGVQSLGNGDPTNSGQLFNTSPVKVRHERWTAVSLYLNELPGWRLSIRRSNYDVKILLRKAFPEGLTTSWRKATWVTHLFRTVLSNFDVECQRRAKNSNS